MKLDGESTQENSLDLFPKKDYSEDILNMEYLPIWLGTTPKYYLHLLITLITLIMKNTNTKDTEGMKVTHILIQTTSTKNMNMKIKDMVKILTESKKPAFVS